METNRDLEVLTVADTVGHLLDRLDLEKIPQQSTNTSPQPYAPDASKALTPEPTGDKAHKIGQTEPPLDIVTYTLPREEEVSLLYAVAPGEAGKLPEAKQILLLLSNIWLNGVTSVLAKNEIPIKLARSKMHLK